MEEYIPLIVSALGGVVFGPIVARLAGGSGVGAVVGGLLGGVAAHYGANAAGLGPLLGESALMMHIQNFLEGGIGGGVLAAIASMVMKRGA
ncbi:MAG: hypothetical protein Q8L84_09040 [Hyphomonas sp.]|nr:hypothetical protein [Hyphomonas sp.]